MDSQVFFEKNRKLILYVTFLVFGALTGHVLLKTLGALFGAALGLFVPSFLDKAKHDARLNKFNNQLTDAIMVIVSSLKAGLSLNQSIEVLCQEMSSPIADEFKVVLKSLRIGVSLEDAFAELKLRVPLEELNFVLSAVLVARETGGDLPSVLMKLVGTLRDRARLRENIMTYTLQGRAQGIIMGCIPLLFWMVVIRQDPHHFDIMFQSDMGKMLMLGAAIAWVAAVVFILKVCKVEI